jgi:light-regulated signal transduction histidine kinase (bacteriophytochrome)
VPSESQDVLVFIHNLSHDMKNILHNILGYAVLLEEEYDVEQVAKIVDLVKKADDLLKDYVANADAGRFGNHSVPD